MIPLNFGLFWSGSKLSYLRYLTFKSLRHFHPIAQIRLYMSTKCNKKGYKWYREKQDFENDKFEKDYIEELPKLNVEIIKIDMFGQYAPNYQSDLCRYFMLNRDSGFYLDTDQIILKSFETLPLDKDFIYSHYYNPQINGEYYPVGVLGACKDSKLIRHIMDLLPKYHNSGDYNSLGPNAISNILGPNPHLLKNSFNAPSRYFYPISNSDEVYKAYQGRFKIPEDSYAIHWFGGHELSQGFNKKYTEEFAQKSNDTISVFLRDRKII